MNNRLKNEDKFLKQFSNFSSKKGRENQTTKRLSQTFCIFLKIQERSKRWRIQLFIGDVSVLKLHFFLWEEEAKAKSFFIAVAYDTKCQKLTFFRSSSRSFSFWWIWSFSWLVSMHFWLLLSSLPSYSAVRSEAAEIWVEWSSTYWLLSWSSTAQKCTRPGDRFGLSFPLSS